MSLPNTIIGAHVHNWYECQFKVDVLPLAHVLSISGIEESIEQAPQYGTEREPIDIATGKVEHGPITISMYAHVWQTVKAYLNGKSLGQGYGLVAFTFTAMATGNPLTGAPPVGDVWAGCKVSKVSKEYGQDVNGSKVDVTFQPLRHRDLDGMTLVNIEL